MVSAAVRSKASVMLLVINLFIVLPSLAEFSLFLKDFPDYLDVATTVVISV